MISESVVGIPVVESEYLAYDEMYVSHTEAKIVVGEIAHFKWRLTMIGLNDRCRKAAVKHIEDQASRILGEPWKVGETAVR